MDVFYSSRKVEKIYSNSKEILKHHEQQVAERIIYAIAYIKAHESLDELFLCPTWRLHELHGSEKGQFSLNVSRNLRLIIRPTGNFKFKSDGGYDIRSIQSVIIEKVTDTHEGKIRRK